MYHDTIAAIGTAMSHSGIGIVRISGEEAVAVADRIFRFKKNKLNLLYCVFGLILLILLIQNAHFIS